MRAKRIGLLVPMLALALPAHAVGTVVVNESATTGYYVRTGTNGGACAYGTDGSVTCQDGTHSSSASPGSGCGGTAGNGRCTAYSLLDPPPGLLPSAKTSLECSSDTGTKVYDLDDGSSDGQCAYNEQGTRAACSGSEGSAGASCSQGCRGGANETGKGSCTVRRL